MNEAQGLRPGRKAIYYLILAVILLALIFLLGEIMVRVSQRFGPATFPFRQFDEQLGVSLIPNSKGAHRRCYDGYVSINSHGMRDRERTPEKPPGEFRIGVFSDSLMEAVHVKPEETATIVLENRLNDELSDGKFEVLNFSVGGYSTLQNYLRYKRDGRKFDLDLVVLVFTDNDLPIIAQGGTDSALGRQQIIGNLYPSPTLQIDGSDYRIIYPEEPEFADLMSKAFRKSSLLYFGYKLINVFRPGSSNWAIRKVVPEWAESRPNAMFLDRDNEFARRGWNYTEFVLQLFEKAVRDSGSRFWVVHWGYDVGTNPWYAELPDESQLPPGFDPHFASRWFREFGERENVEVYDLGQDLGAYVRSEKLSAPYLSFTCDMHLNPRGQQVVADFLYRQLIARKLVPLND